MSGKQSKLEIIGEYFTILFGVFLASIALEVFMIPNGLIDGGITGISIMISTVTGIKLSVLLLVINAPFFFIGYRQLGKRFLIRVTFAMLCFITLLEVCKFIPPILVDTILAAGAGGALLGVGVGFIIRHGGCLDGTETIAILMSRKTELSVGKVILSANLLIYLASAFLFGWDSALYSLGAYIFSYGLIDKVSEGMEQGKVVIAITKNAKVLVEAVFSTLGRTSTWWGVNGYLDGDYKMVYIVVTRMEISELKKIIDEDENSSFVTIIDASDIIGNHVKKARQSLIKERREARLESGQLLKVEE